MRSPKTIISTTFGGTVAARREIEFHAGSGVTIAALDQPMQQSVKVSISASGGGSSDHATLTHLDWPSSGHTGSETSVAAFDAGGAAQVVQATADETMLVRRAGILQWIPLLAACYALYEPTNGCDCDEMTAYSMDYTTYAGGSIT